MGRLDHAARSGREAEAGEARLRAGFTLAAVLLGPLLLFLLYYRLMFPGLTNADALDFAQIGRNLSEGHGFVTYVLRPLALTHGDNAFRQPDMTHGPLYPFLLALAFGAFGAKDTVVAGMSGLFYLLTIPLVYLLGRRLFDHAIGRNVALIFTVNTLTLQYAVSGLHITLCICLMTGLFLALHGLAARAQSFSTSPVSPSASSVPNASAVSRPPRALLGAAGMLAGALYLADPIFFWILPLTLGAVLWLFPARRGAALFWCGLPLALLVTPWLVRNLLVSGDPVFGLRHAEIWMNTRLYPGYNAYHMLPEDYLPESGLFPAVVHKLLVSANQIVVTFPQISAVWILAFFLPSLLFRLQDSVTQAIRAVTLACLTGLFVTMLLFSVQMPLFTCLVPIMLIFALAFVRHLMSLAQMRRASLALACGLMGTTVLYPLYNDLSISERPLTNHAAMSARMLARSLPPDAVCLSDAPWNVAWYGNRPAIWLTTKDREAAAVRGRVRGVDWLFLTEQTREYSPAWQYVYEVFARWNLICGQARAANAPPPARITILDSTRPLMSALRGFTSIAPLPNQSPGVALAVFAPLPEQQARR